MPKRRKRKKVPVVTICPPSLLLFLSQTSNPMIQSFVAKFVMPRSHQSLDVRTAGSGGLVKRHWYAKNETGKELCEHWPTLFVDKQLSQPLVSSRYIRIQLERPVLWHVDTRNEPAYHWAQVEENGKRVWFIWEFGFGSYWIDISKHLDGFFGARKWKTFRGRQTIRQRQLQAEEENRLDLQPVVCHPHPINWYKYGRIRFPHWYGHSYSTREDIACTDERLKMSQ